MLAAMVIGLPLLMLFGLLRVATGSTLTDYTPVWSDEVYYWQQARAFRAAGLDSGYFTYQERPAELGPYYAWGLFVPAAQGTAGVIFGWPLEAIPQLNAVLLSVALAAFVWLTKPDSEQICWLLGILGTFTPLTIYHVTSMLEGTHLALAVLIAALFHRLMVAGPSPGIAGAALAVVGFATFLRPSTGLLLIPLCVLLRPQRPALSSLIGFGLWMVAYAVFSTTSAPYPGPLEVLATLPTEPLRGMRLVLMHARRNLEWVLAGETLEVVHRLQVLAMTIVAAGSVVAFWIPRRRAVEKRSVLGLSLTEASLHAYSLGSIALLYLFLYDLFGWRDYRGTAPHLLFSLLVLIAFKRRAWLASAILVGILMTPFAWNLYVAWATERTEPERRLEYLEWRSRLASVMQYRAGAPSPWCNTLLHSIDLFEHDAPFLLAIPGGIGLSFVSDLDEAPRSEYLAFTDEFYERVRADLNVERVMDVPGGALYRNLASACPGANRTRITLPSIPEQ